ncbi:hypothetical protein [Streptomyces abikoensis]
MEHFDAYRDPLLARRPLMADDALAAMRCVVDMPVGAQLPRIC